MTRPIQGLCTLAPTQASRTNASRCASTLASCGLGNFKATVPPSTSSSAPSSRLYRPSEIRAFRTNPSIVSPLSGTGITGNCRMAALMSAEPASGILGRRAFAQDVGDALFRQRPVHTIAAQQETVVQRHRLRVVVEAHLRLHSERAGKRVRASGALPAHMVGGEAGHT